MTADYEYLREHWKSMANPVEHPEEKAEDQTSLVKDEPSEQ